MFYHFRFTRLLNASNCFIITFSFNDFIHELTFLFKDAIWYKYLGRSNNVFWNVSMQSFYLAKSLRWILHSFLLLIITLFLLFTIYLYDENLGLVAFLSFRVNSISIKGNFFSRFSKKYCTFPQIRMFFCSLLFFISTVLLVLSEVIEINPDPAPDFSNSFVSFVTFCNWNLSNIAVHNFIKMFPLQACNSIYRFDINCLSETYLDNSHHSRDDQLALPGYNLIIT